MSDPQPKMSNGERPAYGPVGITKREYFTAVCLNGLLTGYSYAGMTESFNPEKTSEIAIKFADEIIKQLES